MRQAQAYLEAAGGHGDDTGTHDIGKKILTSKLRTACFV